MGLVRRGEEQERWRKGERMGRRNEENALGGWGRKSDCGAGGGYDVEAEAEAAAVMFHGEEESIAVRRSWGCVPVTTRGWLG
ncbi:hypothetical protein E2C01_082756 [Portunus trituberculatus]|uniref:Uncharacterized protein n=1 Tax=Portunus trituberculatus TaxID=210409 RepID=A0A5B7J1N3_PORTR|nr:hypothetical protein [Portunus trituberculatus]